MKTVPDATLIAALYRERRRRAEIRGIEEDQVAADDGDGQKEEGKTAVQEISAS